ncbi:hypothetical protein BpHYR1_050591 [Brachionus plicatilis]|uniref:Uncharacterized protein n=1 Tax=Brachionus plicatilis TaxID=10195 RepID=A0A3M7S3Z7_BRAPC|nr:hypothetical protein BpHYR1_050591 [Brachionus plicatilis]
MNFLKYQLYYKEIKEFTLKSFFFALNTPKIKMTEGFKTMDTLLRGREIVSHILPKNEQKHAYKSNLNHINIKASHKDTDLED